MISDSEIIKQLKIKEQSLIAELDKVRRQLEAFGEDANSEDIVVGSAQEFGFNIGEVEPYDKYATYNDKILWALKTTRKLMYVKDIVDLLISMGEKGEYKALLKRITHNSSQMFKSEILDADTKQRSYRYFIRSSYNINLK